MPSLTPFRRFRPAALARSTRLVALACLLAAPPFVAAESQDATSCEADLTCSKATSAALVHSFSTGPDLSEWALVTEAGLLTPTASMAKGPESSWRDPVTRMEFNLAPGACYRAPVQGTGTNPARDSARLVCIDSFYLGAYEVTFEEYDQFARATGRDLPDDE